MPPFEEKSDSSLENMLDRAIAAYEAHRGALQRLSSTLVAPSSCSSPQILTTDERDKIIREINTVLEEHPLRFAKSVPLDSARGDTFAGLPASRYQGCGSAALPSPIMNDIHDAGNPSQPPHTTSCSNRTIATLTATTTSADDTSSAPRLIRAERSPWNCSLCHSSTNGVEYLPQSWEQQKQHQQQNDHGIPTSSCPLLNPPGVNATTQTSFLFYHNAEGSGRVWDEKPSSTYHSLDVPPGMERTRGVMERSALHHGARSTQHTGVTYTPTSMLSSSSPEVVTTGMAASVSTPSPPHAKGESRGSVPEAPRPPPSSKIGIPLTVWPVPEGDEMGRCRAAGKDHSFHSPHDSCHRRNFPTLAEQYIVHKKQVSPSTRWPCICSRSPSRSSSAGTRGESGEGVMSGCGLGWSKIEEDEHVTNTLRSRPRRVTPLACSSGIRYPETSNTIRSRSTRMLRDRRCDPQNLNEQLFPLRGGFAGGGGRGDGGGDGGPSRCGEDKGGLSGQTEWDGRGGDSKRRRTMMIAEEQEGGGGAPNRKDPYRIRMERSAGNEQQYKSHRSISFNTPYPTKDDFYDKPLLPCTMRPLRVSPPHRCLYEDSGVYKRATSVLRESSPAAVRFMQLEDEDLQRRKEAGERLLHLMAPSSLKSASGREAETAVLYQLQREQLLLENQLSRMMMERDFLLQRNPKDTGSEPRYSQLHHRIRKVSEDLKRIDRELQVVQGLEQT